MEITRDYLRKTERQAARSKFFWDNGTRLDRKTGQCRFKRDVRSPYSLHYGGVGGGRGGYGSVEIVTPLSRPTRGRLVIKGWKRRVPQKVKFVTGVKFKFKYISPASDPTAAAMTT